MEKVNHPQHYNIPGRKECIVEMEEHYGVEAVKTFCELNAYKYRYRAHLKGGEEDIKKAGWYDDYRLELNKRPVTKAEKIRSMTDDELREFLFRYAVSSIAGFIEHGGAGFMDASEIGEWLAEGFDPQSDTILTGLEDE